MTTLREKLIKIGANVVRHGRYVTFQLAEVAIPRRLFAEILQLIDARLCYRLRGLKGILWEIPTEWEGGESNSGSLVGQG